MEAWNPDGPNVVTVPEGVADLMVAPVNEFIRRRPTIHLDPKLHGGGAVVFKGALPEGVEESYDDEKEALSRRIPAGPFTITGADVPISPKLRITGVRVFAQDPHWTPTVFEVKTGRCRRDIDPETVTDDRDGLEVRDVRLRHLIAEFTLPEGRARADADLLAAQKGA